MVREEDLIDMGQFLARTTDAYKSTMGKYPPTTMEPLSAQLVSYQDEFNIPPLQKKYLNNDHIDMKCPRCKPEHKTFASGLALEDHYNIHHHCVATHKCSYDRCNKVFSNRSTLKVHEKLYVDQEKVLKHTFSVSCNYSTLSAKEMELHISNHRKEKQFRWAVHKECELANKTFNKHVSLQQHSKSHGRRENQGSCTLCEV